MTGELVRSALASLHGVFGRGGYWVDAAMLEKNARRIVTELPDSPLVLDVGGWYETFNRADYVMGLEGRNYAGYYHHRWLIDIAPGALSFRFKPHLLHDTWPCHFPPSTLDELTAEDWVSCLFWEDSFDAREIIQASQVEVKRELERFVAEHFQYSQIYHRFDRDWPGQTPSIRLKQVIKRLLQKLPGCASVGRAPRNERDDFWDGFYEVESRTGSPPRRMDRPREPRS